MLTRRQFLKVGATAAAAGAALPGAIPALGQDAENAASAELIGPDEVPLELSINGTKHKLKVEPRVTLLSALRNRLDITGPKEVCDRGACGACTVLRDGEPINSCMSLAIENAGHEITTVEGISRGDALGPVQAAFVAHDALQCGFCTSGMVLSVHALLARKPKATDADVRHAVSGNLCRCGTYPKVFEAALAAKRKAK